MGVDNNFYEMFPTPMSDLRNFYHTTLNWGFENILSKLNFIFFSERVNQAYKLLIHLKIVFENDFGMKKKVFYMDRPRGELTDPYFAGL